MRRALAPFAALMLFAAPLAAQAANDEKVGTIQGIDAARGFIKVGGADFKLTGQSLADLKVGDRVAVEYRQDDVHDPLTVIKITKK